MAKIIKKITQTQLITEVSKATKQPKKEIKIALQLFLELFKKHDNIATPFGSFIKKIKPARPARKGINPFTKEPTTFKARPKTTTIKFRPNKALKDVLAKAK